MGEIEDYLKKLEELKKKAYVNFCKGNMAEAERYWDEYIDMIDNHGLKGIG